jgi:hypothetical protein
MSRRKFYAQTDRAAEMAGGEVARGDLTHESGRQSISITTLDI